MSGTKANPLDFESLNRSLKRSMDLRDSTKAILRASEKWNETGRTYAVDLTGFAEKMLKFVTFVEANEELVTILKYFGKTMKAISQEGNQMMERCGKEFSEPLAQFIENDFVATAEAKKRVDKAVTEYESTLANVKGGITKHNTIDQSRLIEFTQEMERLREGLNQKRADLASRLDKIDMKVEQKLLSYLYDLMTSQHQGYEIFKAIKPRMDQMKLHIDQVAATREKEVVSTKEGYLLQMNEKNRVKSKWNRNWYVLRDGLFYCKLGKEVDNDSVLDIVLCTVRMPAPRSRSGVGLKETAKHKFEIMTPGKKKPVVFAAETEGDRKEWVGAIQEAISQSLNSQDLDATPVARTRGSSFPVTGSQSSGTSNQALHDGDNRGLERHLERRTSFNTGNHDQELRYLNILRSVPGNDCCADCRNKEPDWASINLGILICLECSGVHRSLGTHISKVRSLTLDKWDPELLIMMKCVGNSKSNKLFEEGMTPDMMPHSSKITAEWRRSHIKAKYAERLYFPQTKPSDDELSEALYNLVSDKGDGFNVTKFIMLTYQGANVNWSNPRHEHKTPLHRAVEMDNLIYVEALTQNGGSPFLVDDRGWTAMHYAAYFDHVRCLNLLLKRGCKVKKDLLDTDGRTALQVAEQYHALECERLLRIQRPVASTQSREGREANGKRERDQGRDWLEVDVGPGGEGSAGDALAAVFEEEGAVDGIKEEEKNKNKKNKVSNSDLQLDLRNRTLMTVGDVETDRYWDFLRDLLALPKKDLPRVTETSRRLAAGMRHDSEPKRDRGVVLSGQAPDRNQSWEAGDAGATKASEGKASPDTKRARRLSLNLSLISAVHKNPPKKSGRENGIAKSKRQSPPLQQRSLNPFFQRGFDRSTTMPDLTTTPTQPAPSPSSTAAASTTTSSLPIVPPQSWHSEEYWEDSSKTCSTDEDDCEEDRESSDSDAVPSLPARSSLPIRVHSFIQPSTISSSWSSPSPSPSSSPSSSPPLHATGDKVAGLLAEVRKERQCTTPMSTPTTRSSSSGSMLAFVRQPANLPSPQAEGRCRGSGGSNGGSSSAPSPRSPLLSALAPSVGSPASAAMEVTGHSPAALKGRPASLSDDTTEDLKGAKRSGDVMDIKKQERKETGRIDRTNKRPGCNASGGVVKGGSSGDDEYAYEADDSEEERGSPLPHKKPPARKDRPAARHDSATGMVGRKKGEVTVLARTGPPPPEEDSGGESGEKKARRKTFLGFAKAK